MEFVLMGYKTYKSKPKMVGDQQVTNTIKADFLESTLLKIDGLIINRTIVSSSYNIKRTEYFIGVHTENAACSITLTLPNASGSVNGRTYIIKDEGGMADTYPIIIAKPAWPRSRPRRDTPRRSISTSSTRIGTWWTFPGTASPRRTWPTASASRR